MKFRTFGAVAVTVSFLTACASSEVASQIGSSPTASHEILGCYGTFGVEATPCPVRLTKRNHGAVTVAVSGPGVALAAVIGSDCAGSGTVCNVTQTGTTQFSISSVPGQNRCGTAYVVFEGLTSSKTPIGTATVKVINRYC